MRISNTKKGKKSSRVKSHAHGGSKMRAHNIHKKRGSKRS